MLSITDGGSLARALSSSLNPHLKRLLRQRSDQLGGDIAEQARFVIVQPGDTVEAPEQQLGWSIFQDPFDGSRFGDPDFTPEWIEDHGFAFECVFIFTDDFAHVLAICGGGIARGGTMCCPSRNTLANIVIQRSTATSA